MIFGTYATLPPISQTSFDLIHAHDDNDKAKDKSRADQRKKEREEAEKKRATSDGKESVPSLRGRNVGECIQLAQVQGSYDLRKLEGSLLILSQKRVLITDLMNTAARRAQSTNGIYTREMQVAAAELELKHFDELQRISDSLSALQDEIANQNSGDVVCLGTKRPASSTIETPVVKREKGIDTQMRTPTSSAAIKKVTKESTGDSHGQSQASSSSSSIACERITEH